jgi:PAS domain S-box-containing protein
MNRVGAQARGRARPAETTILDTGVRSKGDVADPHEGDDRFRTVDRPGSESRDLVEVTSMQDLRGREVGQPASRGIELGVARALAETVGAEETYGRVLDEIGTALGWDLGATWEVSSDDDLRCVAVWQASEAETREFRSLSERIRLARGEGLPGRVWESGEPAWIVDVVADANFPRSQAAANAGLRAALCFPIQGPGEVVGTMEFFTRKLAEPNDELLSSMVVLGSLVGLFVVRRRAEAAVKSRDAMTGAILGAALDAVITMDEGGRVVDFNPAAERIFGYSRDEVVGEDMAELLMPPSLRAPHRHALTRYLQTGQSVYLDSRVELTGMRSDRSEFPIEVTITRIDLPGPATFTGFVRDITERRAAESALSASRARLVETAATERRRLERNLHDGAQQYLNALAAKLRLASVRVADGPDAVGPILNEAQGDLAIAVEELRELARGIHPAILTEHGLGPAVAALADRSPLRVSITRVPEGRLDETLEVAAYYVVAEGLTNIAKYAHADQARVSVVQKQRSLVVEVADDGIGGADMSKGSGLRGLADRVEALGGRLVVDSPPGAGTRLRVEIPTA